MRGWLQSKPRKQVFPVIAWLLSYETGNIDSAEQWVYNYNYD